MIALVVLIREAPDGHVDLQMIGKDMPDGATPHELAIANQATDALRDLEGGRTTQDTRIVRDCRPRTATENEN